MNNNSKEDQFSPHSRSSSPSLDLKASSPDEKELVDIIDRYEEKIREIYSEHDSEYKEESILQNQAMQEIEEKSKSNILKRPNSNKDFQSDDDSNASASRKKIKLDEELDRKSLQVLEQHEKKDLEETDLNMEIEEKANSSKKKTPQINMELELKEGIIEGKEIAIERELSEDDNFDPETTIRRKKTLKDDFEPGTYEPIELSEEDLKIIRTDIPERLQIRGKIKEVNNENLIEEAKWIYEHFKAQRNEFFNEILLKKVQKALSFLKVSHYEVIFQYFYKKNELLPEIQLNDLWEILEFDEEWDKITNLKNNIRSYLKSLEEYMEIPKITRDFFEKCSDYDSLIHVQDYVIFHLSKFVDGETMQKKNVPDSLKEFFPKKNSKTLFVYEAIQYKLEQFASKAGLSSDEFAENLTLAKSHKKPALNISPEQVAQEYIIPGKSLVNNAYDTMINVCRYMASEIFQDPTIKQYFKKLYFENVCVSTEPTPHGNAELNALHPYYIVKRINRRPPFEFKDDLWLRILKCEKEGLIKVYFSIEELQKTSDNNIDNHFNDMIYNKLLNQYIAPFSNALGDEKKLIEQWNIFRSEVIRILLFDLFYPYFEKVLRDELTKTSEKYVVNLCCKKLKEMLNIAPYLVPKNECISSKKGESFDKPRIVSVVLETINQQQSSDRISFVSVDTEGLFIDSLTLRFFATQNLESQNQSIKDAFEKDYFEFERFMLKHQPNLVLVSANCLDSKRIKQMILKFRDDSLKSKFYEENKIFEEPEIIRPKEINTVEGVSEEMENISFKPQNSIREQITNFEVIYGDNTMAFLFAKTTRAELEFKGVSASVKEGVSLARFVQNPMSEILNLWNEKNQLNALFYIPFHPLQSNLTSARLRREFEKTIVEVVNSVGVDFNNIVRFDHLSSNLQFVAGLGPRKAFAIIESLKVKLKSGFKGINTRSQLLSERLMEKRVFTNCAGFLKLDPTAISQKNSDEKYYETLDITRIHPDNYQLAKKIAKDALEEDGEVNPEDLIPKIMRSSFKLKELDLEDYSHHMATLKNKTNMIYVLNFIVDELISPFKDPRKVSYQDNSKEIFYRINRLHPESFKIGSILNGKIIKIMKSNLMIKLENGLVGSVFYLDIFEKKEARSENLNQFFEQGCEVKVKVKNIDFEKFKIELTMRHSELKFDKNHLKDLFPDYWDTLSKYFKIREEDDFPIFENKIALKNQIRTVNHEKFQDITYQAAIEFLSEKEIGDFIIRKTSKPDNYTITWKFYDKIFVHLDFKENSGYTTFPSTPHFALGKELFDSLDLLLKKTVLSCNTLMNSVMEHRKFRKDDLESIEKALFEEKGKESNMTPYFFGCSERAPQFLVLLYLLSSGEAIKEFIKVKPEGLFFHNSYFKSVKTLITYFKENQRTDEYQKFLQKAKPPFFDIDEHLQSANQKPQDNIWNMDSEPIERASISSNKGINSNQQNQRPKWGNEENFQSNPERNNRERNFEERRDRPPRPQCSFCNRMGHTEDRCFQKNGRNKPAESERPSLENNSAWNMTKVDEKPSNTENITWGGAEDTTTVKPTVVEGNSSWGQTESNDKPQTAQTSWENKGNDTAPAWGNQDYAEKPKISEEKAKVSSGWGEETSDNQVKASSSWGNETENKGWASGGFEQTGKSNDYKGGRNSGGGGGNRSCYNCGEEGHMSRDCPQPKKERGGGGDRGSERKKGCFKCGDLDHMSRDCTKEGIENNNKSRNCRICNKEGHFAKDCPEKKEGGGPKKCFNCGEEGHMKQDCPEPPKKRVPKCFNCDKEGHVSKECPEEKKPFCHNCKEKGHWTKACTKDKQENNNNGNSWSGGATTSWGNNANNNNDQTNSWGNNNHNNSSNREENNESHGGRNNNNRRPMKCFNCDQEGHMSKDCPEEKKPFCHNCKEKGHWTKHCTKEKPGDNNNENMCGANNSWGGNNASNISNKNNEENNSWGNNNNHNDNDNKNNNNEGNNSWGDSNNDINKNKEGNIWGDSNTDTNKNKEGNNSWGDSSNNKSGGWNNNESTTRQDNFNRGRNDHENNESHGGRNNNNRRPMKCFNCDQEGHMSKECPEEKKPFCHNCKEKGHWTKHCTQEKNNDTFGENNNSSAGGNNFEERKNNNRRPIKCHNCDEEGHLSKDCEKPPAKICINCKEKGHWTYECEKEKTMDNTNDKSKENPWEGRNNNRNNENNNFRSNNSRVPKCYNCDEEGHMTKECPQEKKPYCFNCKEKGHWTKECQKSNENNGEKNNDWSGGGNMRSGDRGNRRGGYRGDRGRGGRNNNGGGRNYADNDNNNNNEREGGFFRPRDRNMNNNEGGDSFDRSRSRENDFRNNRGGDRGRGRGRGRGGFQRDGGDNNGYNNGNNNFGGDSTGSGWGGSGNDTWGNSSNSNNKKEEKIDNSSGGNWGGNEINTNDNGNKPKETENTEAFGWN